MRLLKASYDFYDEVSFDEFKYCTGKMGYTIVDFCIFQWKGDKIIGFLSYDMTHEEVEILGECFKKYLVEYRNEQEQQKIPRHVEG